MPRLWIFSDLHQDWASNAWDTAAHSPDFDIAVVAGDVHSPLTNAIDWLADHFAGVDLLYAGHGGHGRAFARQRTFKATQSPAGRSRQS